MIVGEEKKEIIIDIPELVVNFIQRLDAECQSYRNIISYILTHDNMNITTERFKKYQEDYVNSVYAFEIAKQEFAKEYLLSNKISWNLDYQNNKLIYFDNEGDK